jgi:hypothetical protein
VILFTEIKNNQDHENVMTLIEEFSKKHSIEMHHFKKTCPNPHSGEKYFGYRADGAIFDLLTKKGLWVTNHEFETMKMWSSDFVEIDPTNLESSEVVEKYRGSRAAKEFDI